VGEVEQAKYTHKNRNEGKKRNFGAIKGHLPIT